MHKKILIDKDWLYRKYIIENFSVEEIAKMKNCSISSIYRFIKKYNFYTNRKPNKYNFFKEDIYKEYFVIKKTQKEIAEKYGCTQELIQYYMKKFGLKARTVIENRKIGKHPMLGKENKWGKHTEETKTKISKALSGENNPMWGKHLTKDHKKKLSKAFTGNKNPMWGRVGDKSPVWKPPSERKGNLYKQIRRCFLGEEWRKSCLERDKFTCQKCGDSKGGNLNVHHIKFLNEIIKENNIKTLEDAIANFDLWDKNNGITLCEICHKNLHKAENL